MFITATLKLNNKKVLSIWREANRYDGFKFHLGRLHEYENLFTPLNFHFNVKYILKCYCAIDNDSFQLH